MSRRSTSVHDAEYDEFVAASWRRLCWTAYMLTGDRQLAEDLAQTALVKTYVAWPRVRRVRLRPEGPGQREHRPPPASAPHRGEGLAIEAATRPDSEVENRDHVVRLLAGLTELERKVMVLRYYFDLSEKDTADEIGVGVGTVKSTAARARAKIREGPLAAGDSESMRGVS